MRGHGLHHLRDLLTFRDNDVVESKHWVRLDRSI